MKSTIFLYPGYVTKGQKGRIFWHPAMPDFDPKQNDWDQKKAVELTNCIHDPWPSVEGGKECMIEITHPKNT